MASRALLDFVHPRVKLVFPSVIVGNPSPGQQVLLRLIVLSKVQ